VPRSLVRRFHVLHFQWTVCNNKKPLRVHVADRTWSPDTAHRARCAAVDALRPLSEQVLDRFSVRAKHGAVHVIPLGLRVTALHARINEHQISV